MSDEYWTLYKTAALDFLNNISLDGIYIDNKICIGIKCEPVPEKVEMKLLAKETNTSISGRIKPIANDQISNVSRVLSRRMFETFCSRKRRTTSSSSVSSTSDDKTSGLKSKLTKQRLVVVSPNLKNPFTIYSILPFKKRKRIIKLDGTLTDKTEISRSRMVSGISAGTLDNSVGFSSIQIPMEEDTSYQHFLKPIIYQEGKNNLLNIPTKSNLSVTSVKPSKSQDLYRYDPNLLDDPEMTNSRKKVVLQLPCYLTTIINYVRPVDMKSDINEQFRQKFPDIKLTLSKLRSLKGNILSVSKKCGIDLWTVANAFVYFETLVLKNLITKNNRKLCCAAALILSAKMNDIRGSELAATIQELESTFRIHRREIFQYELYVFIALEFGLLLCDKTVNVHYKRLNRTF